MILGENGGDRAKIIMCNVKYLGETEVFLDKFFVSKIEHLLTMFINVQKQKQLDLSRQICLSSFAK